MEMNICNYNIYWYIFIIFIECLNFALKTCFMIKFYSHFFILIIFSALATHILLFISHKMISILLETLSLYLAHSYMHIKKCGFVKKK